MNDKYWLEVVRDESICPRCKADTHADRIARNWWVRLLFGWLLLRRYMCYKCKRNYYTIEKRKQINMPMR